MSNTKEVWIEGVMPFNVYEHDAAKGWLGLMNAPSIGIRIGYSEEYYKPMPNGGKLSMHYFTISGREAISYDALFQMCKDFVAAGVEVTKLMTKDLDDNGVWENYLDEVYR